MRKYTVPFSVATNAACELVEIVSPGTKTAVAKRVVAKCPSPTLPAAQQFAVRGNVLTGAPVAGSAPAPTLGAVHKTDPGDATNQCTAAVGNSTATQATGTATNTQPYEDASYLYLGIDAMLPGDGMPFSGGDIFQLLLISAPAGSLSITIAGFVEFWEFGG